MSAYSECPICSEAADVAVKGYGFAGYPCDILEVHCPDCRGYLITGTALAGVYDAALARSRSGKDPLYQLALRELLAKRRWGDEDSTPLLHELDVLSR